MKSERKQRIKWSPKLAYMELVMGIGTSASKMYYRKSLPCLERKYRKLKLILKRGEVNLKKARPADVAELVDAQP